MSQTDVQIKCEDGIVQLHRKKEEDPFEVTLVPRNSDLYVPRKSCQTTFSLEMIEFFLSRGRFAWLCDNIARHEDSSVPGALKSQLFSYFAPSDFVGKRLLDFACGRGASSMVMAKMLPQTQIVGVELDPERIEIANRIKSFRGLDNVRFLCSPAGDKLPPDMGEFDFVVLSAVYEHLLPHERKILMPLLWSALKPGASILINQTPYRYSPYEDHSTGLWFINYLPDNLAHFAVRHFAGRNPRVNKSPDWNAHLRGGLRGGTEAEIIRNLTRGDTSAARILQPCQNGVRDRADLWLSNTNPQRYRSLKKLIASTFRLTDKLWGTIPGINLEVVIQKQR